MTSKRVLVTGGAGFIGSALVRRLVSSGAWSVTNVDALTYAGNLDSLRSVEDASGHRFVRADICDRDLVRGIIDEVGPEAVVHLAAESHVDRSIDGPLDFVRTNVLGTAVMLEEVRRYWQGLGADGQRDFRFLHVSTDEVFGALGAEGRFDESTPYDPSSPYSASKAGADHLVRAWERTYGLPVVITNCSNNYGPYQFPEKLIPLMILNAMEGKSLPVYGKGANVRDWLHVEDHVSGLLAALEVGTPGSTYVIGGAAERSNLEVVHAVCDAVDEALGPGAAGPRRNLVEFVPDRPGHDFRYAIDASKAISELGWKATRDFGHGLAETVRWYIDNEWWWERVRTGAYRGARVGLSAGGSRT